MPCNIKNPANLDLSELEPHVQGMYDHFDQKIGFNKPPTMIFDSDPGNQANVLGKTAYYDPSTLEIHVYSDGRHPKDMLRSIAHELIHHRQNLEGRLQVDGYHGEGYYLENKELKKLEHEAMLEGNAFMREYEDTLKRKENKEMSLNEWRNNELNQLLMKRFGILKEGEMSMKTDIEDADDDGKTDDKVPAFLKKEEIDEGIEDYHGDVKNNGKPETAEEDDELKKKNKVGKGPFGRRLQEDSGEDEKDEKDHYEDNRMSDAEHIKAIEYHLAALRKDKNYDDDHSALEEQGGSDKKDPRNHRITNRSKPMEENNPAGSLANSKFGGDGMPEDELTEGQKINTLKESIKRVLKKNKKIKLRFKK